MPEIRAEVLEQHTTALLEREGLPRGAAEAITDHLVHAELWGRASHGVSVRLPKILEEARNGLGRRRPEVVSDDRGTVVLDGLDGFGFLAAAHAAELLVERAGRHRVATVALRNSGHTGLLAYYLNRISRAGVIGLAFAHCMPVMAPHGAVEPFFGTNPIGFGFPADPAPVIIDLATSQTTYGEVARRRQNHEELEDGWAIDNRGAPTTDADEALAGALLPFGGYKGSALALAVQLIAGPTIGALPLPPRRVGYGLAFIGIAHDAFQDSREYYRGVAELLGAYHNVATTDGRGPHLPGRRYSQTVAEAPDTLIAVSAETARLLGLP